MNMREFRERCDMTAAQFADKLGVHPQTVYNWERGVKIPSPQFWEQLDSMGIEYPRKLAIEVALEPGESVEDILPEGRAYTVLTKQAIGARRGGASA